MTNLYCTSGSVYACACMCVCVCVRACMRACVFTHCIMYTYVFHESVVFVSVTTFYITHFCLQNNYFTGCVDGVELNSVPLPLLTPTMPPGTCGRPCGPR